MLLVVAVVLVACFWRAWDGLALKWEADRRAAWATTILSVKWEARRVRVEERKLALLERQAERPDASDAMIPADLLSRVREWEDTWAQEAEEANLRSLFAVSRDWDKVRQQLPTHTPPRSRTEDLLA